MSRVRRSCLGGVATIALACAAPAFAVAADGLQIKVLSNRADLVSGGDALVEIELPRGANASRLRLVVAGRSAGERRRRDVTGSMAMRPGGRYMGVVRPLFAGRNVLLARVGAARARARIVNHPNGGPVFSGPQIKPWECQETAKDRKCNEPVSYSYVYGPSDGGALEPYDPANPPSDVGMTTTDRGVTVPFIVRIETGYQDRDQYEIATLWQPGKRWAPWAPQRQWNHKLLITHGAGCGVSYGAGSAPALFGPTQVGIPGIDDLLQQSGGDVGKEALGRGFAVMSTALNHNGHACNIAVQAESMVMAKEHLIETYGPLRYTIASGCSGGAVTQQQVANAYPGLYQGLTPQCSYPDTFSPGTQFADYHLLRLYFEDPSRWGPGIVWLPTQWADVEGHLAHVNAITADEGLFKSAINPRYLCDHITPQRLYHPTANPRGVRCSVLDYMINVLGPRPRRVWSAIERKIGRGFAGTPFGNVGVQYGLGALRSGLITADQFVDLNREIGGLDVDVQPIPQRIVGDGSALRAAYRSGAFNAANHLDQVAIINLGGPDPGIAHDYSHAWWMRARIEREQGHRGNYVMWFGQFPVIGSVNFQQQALIAMDRWLTAVERDHRRIPLPRKIVLDRPGSVHDRCENIPEIETPAGLCKIPVTQTRLGTPRTVAGAPLTSEIGACRLKPLVRTDYYPMEFSDAQWAGLREAFPSGVCDWTRPGRGQQDTIAWLSYSRADGSVVHGGRPMPAAPRGSGGGWTSASFAGWRNLAARR